MEQWWFWVAVALALVPLKISIGRGTELFVVKVQAGRARFLRGRLPLALLTDIEDIVAKPPVERAKLRAVKRNGAAEWLFEGQVSPGQKQQLRNALALYSLVRIAAGAKPRRGAS